MGFIWRPLSPTASDVFNMASSSRSASDCVRHEVASQLIPRVEGDHVVVVPWSALNACSLLIILSCRNDALGATHGGVIRDRRPLSIDIHCAKLQCVSPGGEERRLNLSQIVEDPTGRRLLISLKSGFRRRWCANWSSFPDSHDIELRRQHHDVEFLVHSQELRTCHVQLIKHYF